MARYTYTAKDNTGKIYKGTTEAKNEGELREQLKDVGFYVLSLKRERSVFTFGQKKVIPAELVTFSRQFSTMVNAGLPLITSLGALEKQTDNPSLRKIINEVKINIEGGISLSEAMAKYPSAFSEFFTALIRAGETGGVLSKTLERLANHLEKQDSLKRSVKSAFAYPIIVGTLAFLVVSFLIIVIVPIFQKVYARMHLILPGPTLVLIGASNFVRNFWWLILLLIGALIFSWKWISKNSLLRERLDSFKLNMPIFGKLMRGATVARFVRTLGDMITSGVVILESLRIADKVAANRVVSKITQEMIDNVQRGGLVSEPLKRQDIFPAGVTQMIASGEEIGKLGFMLEKSADGLERDVDDTVKRLVVKIEPLMTFLMALLVGFIAIAIYLPIFDVIKHMSL